MKLRDFKDVFKTVNVEFIEAKTFMKIFMKFD